MSKARLLIALMVLIIFSAHGQIPAFPGAEGFGTATTHGRGGRVIYVSNLNDAGPGSLRAACETSGKRIIVFATGGIIDLRRNIVIDDPYCMIAGQRAPGEGICLRGAGLKITTHDVVVRYLRIRPGDGEGEIPERRDGITVETEAEAYNIVIDHCSVSWAIDENIGIYTKYQKEWPGTIRDVTIQWSIISEGLDRSRHPKGPHSKGLLYGGGAFRSSLHHNVMAHHAERNPLYQTGASADIVNNIIHNGPGGVGYTNQGNWDTPGYLNIVGNHAIAGQRSQGRHAVLTIDRQYTDYLPEVYLKDNLAMGRTAASQPEWEAASLTNVDVSELQVNQLALASPKVTTYPVEQLLDQLLPSVGASLPVRDAVDTRITEELRRGAAGDIARSGRIIDRPAQVGGYPSYPPGRAATDRDADGMPDAWEDQYGLDGQDASDNNQDADGDGYLNVEEFLNGTHPRINQSTAPTASYAVIARGSTGEEQLSLLIDQRAVQTWTLSEDWTSYVYDGPAEGVVRVAFINDGRTVDGRDRNVRVDYLVVESDTLSAEDQATNTGNWSTTEGCGGGGSSEWLYCAGYIEFEATKGRTRYAHGMKEETTAADPPNLLQVYPNPANDQVNIVLPEGPCHACQLEVIDSQGRVMYRSVAPKGLMRLSTEQFPRGVYIIKALGSDEQWTQRLIIE